MRERQRLLEKHSAALEPPPKGRLFVVGLAYDWGVRYSAEDAVLLCRASHAAGTDGATRAQRPQPQDPLVRGSILRFAPFGRSKSQGRTQAPDGNHKEEGAPPLSPRLAGAAGGGNPVLSPRAGAGGQANPFAVENNVYNSNGTVVFEPVTGDSDSVPWTQVRAAYEG